jgi:hypothetical protein
MEFNKKKNKEKLNWINSTLFIGRSEHFQKQEAKSNSTVQKKKELLASH